ncbi:MAG: M61 family metallopeptidase [Sphingomonadales bacterium]|nr:M61 family metallopeptidase [Sphingomonadales bacterium]
MAQIHYTIGADPLRPRHLKVRLAWETDGSITALRLPQWRPGRYEQGNFTRNLVALSARYPDTPTQNYEHAEWITVTKTTSAEWVLRHSKGASLIVEYSYLANQADAGACWVDQELLYVNPVHCCLYIPGQEHHPCTLRIDTGRTNSEWKVAIALPVDTNGTYSASSFHELVDSPFLASPRLQAVRWSAEGIDFVLWIQGETFPDGDEGTRILREFQAFCSEQILTMGSFPVDTFHFMLLALPYSFYHGVEHLRSTVLALGPSNQIWTTLYKELMGVASHELFHVWNIKSIRPAAMQPYHYEGLMFNDLGYVYEGFTTYYGDLFLVRSGILSFEEYLEEVNSYLLRHTLNYGRYNHSLHESSVDTWVDGYSSLQSAPHRRVSIYAEGMLQALHLDLTLRHSSQNTISLDDLMRFLWKEHRRNPSQGYSEKDIIDWLNHSLPLKKDWDLYFQEHYAQPMSLEDKLALVLEPLGCTLVLYPCEDTIQRTLGVQMQWNKGLPTVEHTVPGAPAALGGLGLGDRWLAWQTVLHSPSDSTDSRSIALETINIEALKGIEEPAALQTKARQILRNVLGNGDVTNQAQTEWSDHNPEQSSLVIQEEDTLLVLYVNSLGHYGIACMSSASGVTFYNHYKITPSEKVTSDQLTNRKAWISSSRQG